MGLVKHFGGQAKMKFARGDDLQPVFVQSHAQKAHHERTRGRAWRARPEPAALPSQPHPPRTRGCAEAVEAAAARTVETPGPALPACGRSPSGPPPCRQV